MQRRPKLHHVHTAEPKPKDIVLTGWSKNQVCWHVSMLASFAWNKHQSCHSTCGDTSPLEWKERTNLKLQQNIHQKQSNFINSRNYVFDNTPSVCVVSPGAALIVTGPTFILLAIYRSNRENLLTVHWKTLQEHFLMRPLFWGKVHFLNFPQKALKGLVVTWKYVINA
jgi:hypothetical protein